MEVPGKRRDPGLDKGSADGTVYCQPCEEGGKRAVAQGFCQTCEDYICAPCIEYYKRLRMSKNHILLSKDKMPSFYPSTKKSAIADTDNCKKHPKEILKFFCPTHGVLGCGDCIVLDHRSCKADYIADVAKEFVSGNDSKEVEQSIKWAEDLLSGYISNVKGLLDEIENHTKGEMDRLRKFRAEINTYLDRREKDLLGILQQVKTEDENVLHNIQSNFALIKTGLEVMRMELTSGEVSMNQRYVTARRAQKELRVFRDEFWKITGRMKARKYRFTKDADTERLLRSKTGIGTLEMAGYLDIPVPDLSTVTWMKGAHIPVRTPKDKKTCWISASAVLSPSLFILTDLENDCVKLMNVTTRTVMSRLQLPGGAWDVCVLPDDQAAVTLSDKSIIQLLSTKGGQLSCGKNIKVSSRCRGIAWYNNRLYVSYAYNPRIDVITLDGHIISTFKRDSERHFFQNPHYLTVSASTPPTLYVSDQDQNTVFQLSLDGKDLREYRNKELEYPDSVVEVGPGQLLVCCGGSHNVMLLTERDGKMAEILGRNDVVSNPFSVAFCPYTLTIVVGTLYTDSLTVFNAN